MSSSSNFNETNRSESEITLDLERRFAEAERTIDDLRRQKSLSGGHQNESTSEREEGYRDIADRSPDGIMVHTDGVIVYANPSLARLFGVESAEELIGKQGIEFAAPEEQDRIRFRRKGGNTGGEPFMNEGRFIRTDGSETFLESAISQVNWNGKQSFLVIFRDVNTQRLTRQAMNESEQRYRDLAQLSPDGIMVHTDGKIVFANPSLARILGVASPDDLIGTEAIAFAAPEEHERIHEHRRRAEAGGPTASEDARFIRADGSETYVERALSVVNWAGKPSYLVIFREVNNRRNAENLLRESETRLDAIINHAPFVIYLKDLDGKFVLANRNYAEALDISPQDLLGKTTHGVMPKAFADQMIHQDNEVIRTLAASEIELSLTRKDGTTVTRSSIKFPVFGTDGDLVAIGGFSIDLTEVRQREEALRQAQKMEAVGQLTGGVAHDFNNLLGVTMGNAQLLASKLEDRNDLQAMANTIVKASQRGAELTHRLLAFSRQQTLQPKPVELVLLCEDMSDLLRRSLGETIEIDIISGNDPWTILADPGEVESALLNLAINASHAMPNGGKLEIKIENASVTDREWAELWNGQPGEYVALGVIDHGTGMPKHVLEHVFEPFFSTKGVGQGSGLGLSMVHGFARQSGGFTTIESEEGNGTTVTIYLPKAQLAHKTQEARKTDSELQLGLGETVLVVEDEPAVRQITTNLLESLGYAVVTAKDGIEALSVASNADRIDLLLLDIVLPGGMNGIEVYENIHRQRPEIGCLFMSGYSSLPDHQIPDGTELLPKPIRLSDLANKIRLYLDA